MTHSGADCGSIRFTDAEGNPVKPRPEIWAYGLRTPWRMNFDPSTGELWVADVGQNTFEEVNRVNKGYNLGWNRMEGSVCFEPPDDCDRESQEPRDERNGDGPR